MAVSEGKKNGKGEEKEEKVGGVGEGRKPSPTKAYIPDE